MELPAPPQQQSHADNPFDLRNAFPNLPLKPLSSWALKLAEHLLGFRAAEKRHARWQAHTQREGNTLAARFPRHATRMMHSSLNVSEDDLARIPATGSLVVVANHPFGMIEGLHLIEMIQRVRPDVKIMANSLLGRIPEVQPFLIGVNPYATEAASRENLRPMREALNWLKQGGVMIVFPAGDVAKFSIKRRALSDREWSPVIGRLIAKAGCNVLPVFVAGRNSLAFHTLGLLHPRVRTAMLVRELVNKRGKRISVSIGNPVEAKDLAELASDSARINYLRVRTFVLAGRVQGEEKIAFPKAPKRREVAVAPALAPDILMRELKRLDARDTLVDREDYKVIALRAWQCPLFMQELGRVREITFRANHEGTGRARDLDKYDQDYLHLILWDVKKQAIAGGYRLGLTDEILARRGVRGLYTRKLFKYDERLLEQITPAIELGRSFVAQDYQRAMAPLLLLWQGIGTFLVRNPRYRYLFGPVSIHAEYHTMSKELMLAFLTSVNASPLAGLVKAKSPPKDLQPWRVVEEPSAFDVLPDIDRVSSLVSEIEADHKGVPVLLKHYLRMGAQLLSSNIDAQFGYVLDGLLLTDLAKTPERVLRRYLGADGASSYLSYHAGTQQEVTHDASQ